MYNNGDNWPIGEVEVFLALWDGARIKSTRHEKLSYFTFASASWIQAEWPSHQMSPAQLVGELDSPDVHPNHWWAPPEERTWDSGLSGPEILLELWVFPLRLEKSQNSNINWSENSSSKTQAMMQIQTAPLLQWGGAWETTGWSCTSCAKWTCTTVLLPYKQGQR